MADRRQDEITTTNKREYRRTSRPPQETMQCSLHTSFYLYCIHLLRKFLQVCIFKLIKFQSTFQHCWHLPLCSKQTQHLPHIQFLVTLQGSHQWSRPVVLVISTKSPLGRNTHSGTVNTQYKSEINTKNTKYKKKIQKTCFYKHHDLVMTVSKSMTKLNSVSGKLVENHTETWIWSRCK